MSDAFKVYAEQDVYSAALDRVRTLYDRFDTVVVSFSGGKDSTAALNVVLEVARERGRLPLDLVFWDEECITPETVDYVERVRALPEIRLKWLCLPIKHRNGCSLEQPYWHPWNPAERDLWVRPLPEGAITELRGFHAEMGHVDAAHLVYGPEHGQVACVLGIRAQESLRRLRMITKRGDNWLSDPGARGSVRPLGWASRQKPAWMTGQHYSQAYPVYDWEVADVWTAPHLLGWDYNRTYDLYYKYGFTFHAMRLSNPFGDEPMTNLGMWRELWPDLWHKMIARVPGSATVVRYCKSGLYGYGGQAVLPEGSTWKEHTFRCLELYPAKTRPLVANSVLTCIKRHNGITKRPIPEAEPDPASGISWKFLALIALKGDLKGRRSGKMTNNGELYI